MPILSSARDCLELSIGGRCRPSFCELKAYKKLQSGCSNQNIMLYYLFVISDFAVIFVLYHMVSHFMGYYIFNIRITSSIRSNSPCSYIILLSSCVNNINTVMKYAMEAEQTSIIGKPRIQEHLCFNNSSGLTFILS